MGDVPKELQDSIDAIRAKYQPKIDELVARGKKIAEDYDQPGGIGALYQPALIMTHGPICGGR